MHTAHRRTCRVDPTRRYTDMYAAAVTTRTHADAASPFLFVASSPRHAHNYSLRARTNAAFTMKKKKASHMTLARRANSRNAMSSTCDTANVIHDLKAARATRNELHPRAAHVHKPPTMWRGTSASSSWARARHGRCAHIADETHSRMLNNFVPTKPIHIASPRVTHTAGKADSFTTGKLNNRTPRRHQDDADRRASSRPDSRRHALKSVVHARAVHTNMTGREADGDVDLARSSTRRYSMRPVGLPKMVLPLPGVLSPSCAAHTSVQCGGGGGGAFTRRCGPLTSSSSFASSSASAATSLRARSTESWTIAPVEEEDSPLPSNPYPTFAGETEAGGTHVGRVSSSTHSSVCRSAVDDVAAGHAARLNKPSASERVFGRNGVSSAHQTRVRLMCTPTKAVCGGEALSSTRVRRPPAAHGSSGSSVRTSAHGKDEDEEVQAEGGGGRGARNTHSPTSARDESMQFIRCRVGEISEAVVWHRVKSRAEAEHLMRRLERWNSNLSTRVMGPLSDIMMALDEMKVACSKAG